ncbi:hypothetical protein [Nocardia salmonicida]|uniref:hypothetical protein n=1 Tax=Nocardia salmonicida TaxID=53431 RepID=UPI003CF5FC42
MIRATLATLLGGGLGLVEQEPFPVLDRDPVRGDRDNPVASKRHVSYRNRRGSGAYIGKQRVGLLFWNERGDAEVLERPQFKRDVPAKKPGATVPSPKVPSVQWRVIITDLVADAADKRAAVRQLYGAQVYVVWAWAAVADVPRPLAYAVGLSPEHAMQNAQAADRRDIAGPSTSPRAGEPQFVDSAWKLSDAPVAQPMILFPTNLANLDVNGNPTADKNGAANCYLLTPENAGLGPTSTATNPERMNVSDDALRTLSRVLARHYWQNGIKPADRLEHGWPVFFDAAQDSGGETVIRLGGSNGFPIKAEHTVRDSVTNATPGRRDSWLTKIAAVTADNDAVVGLFGAVDGTNQVAARIDVGHATVWGAVQPLTKREPVLLTPHIEAAHTRLVQKGDPADPTTFSIGTPEYRGREVYWHRGNWPSSRESDSDGGQKQWATVVEEKVQRQETQMGAANRDADAPTLGTPMAPLPVGTCLRARINFTNLTGPELGALLFALRFPAASPSPNPEPAFAHKLGGGGTLGLGSVTCAADLFLHSASRYLSLAEDGLDRNDGDGFVTEFLDALCWQPTESARPGWRHEFETARRWPTHVAAWLTAARWRYLPDPELTAEMGVAEHKYRRPMLDVFGVAERADERAGSRQTESTARRSND